MTQSRREENRAPYYQVSEVDLVFQSSCQKIELNSGRNLSMELCGLNTSVLENLTNSEYLKHCGSFSISYTEDHSEMQYIHNQV